MFNFRQITLFCLEKRLKVQNDLFSKNLGAMGPFGPPGYDYGNRSTSICTVATTR